MVKLNASSLCALLLAASSAIAITASQKPGVIYARRQVDTNRPSMHDFHRRGFSHQSLLKRGQYGGYAPVQGQAPRRSSISTLPQQPQKKGSQPRRAAQPASNKKTPMQAQMEAQELAQEQQAYMDRKLMAPKVMKIKPNTPDIPSSMSQSGSPRISSQASTSSSHMSRQSSPGSPSSPRSPRRAHFSEDTE